MKRTQVPDLPAGFVVKGVGTGYFVKSRTTDGAWWLVSGNACSCPHCVERPTCWHRKQVAAFCARIAAENPRPRADDSSAAVVSRFVD